MDKIKAEKLLKKLRGYSNDMEWYAKTVFKEMETEKNIEKVINKLDDRNIHAPLISNKLVEDTIAFLEELISKEP